MYSLLTSKARVAVVGIGTVLLWCVLVGLLLSALLDPPLSRILAFISGVVFGMAVTPYFLGKWEEFD